MDAYYEAIAPAYVQHRRVHPEVLERLALCARQKPASRVLEIGCGTGNYLAALRDVTDSLLHGVEPVAAMLAEAGRQVPGACFTQASAEQTGLESTQFDLIYAVDVVHHLRDLPAAFAESRRLLRPRGWLAIATDSPEMIRRRRPLSEFFPETVAIELARYPQPEALQHELALSGFTNVRSEEVRTEGLLTNFEAYQTCAFSCLRLLPENIFHQGLRRMEEAGRTGPMPLLSEYLLLWAQAPSP